MYKAFILATLVAASLAGAPTGATEQTLDDQIVATASALHVERIDGILDKLDTVIASDGGWPWLSKRYLSAIQDYLVTLPTNPLLPEQAQQQATLAHLLSLEAVATCGDSECVLASYIEIADLLRAVRASLVVE